MPRPAAPLCLFALLLIAACARASSGPTRQPCDQSPEFSQTYSQVNGANLSVVALGDDFGPTTLVASFGGSVYVYYRTVTNDTKGRTTYGDWSLFQTIEAPASSPETASFGASLSISSDVLAVGQPQWQLVNPSTNAHTGAVSILRRSGPGTNYTYEKLIYEDDLLGSVPRDAEFGTSVSLVMDGTLLLVGAPGCCEPDYIGNAFSYFYTTTGNETTPDWVKTVGPAQTQVLKLGQSVQISDTTPLFVLLGAPGDVSSGPGVFTATVSASTGDVDTATRSELPQNALTITPPPDEYSECGYAISNVDEVARRVVWTCPGFDNATGAIYTSDLVGNQWSTSRRVQSSAPVIGARFGQSVALQAPILIVTEGTDGGGTVYQYEIVPVTLKPEDYMVRSMYSYTNTLSSPQNLTISVDFRGNVLAVGAYGTLYVYECPLASGAAHLAAALSAVLLAFVALLF